MTPVTLSSRGYNDARAMYLAQLVADTSTIDDVAPNIYAALARLRALIGDQHDDSDDTENGANRRPDEARLAYFGTLSVIGTEVAVWKRVNAAKNTLALHCYAWASKMRRQRGNCHKSAAAR